MADTFDTQGFATEARSHGYSWDEINTHLDGFREHALQSGYSGDEIDQFLGYNTTSDLEQKLRAHADLNLNSNAEKLASLRDKPEVSGSLDAFINGLELSAPGLMMRNELPSKEMPQDPDMMTRLAHAAGMAVGDLPFNLVGALGGAAAGTAVSPGVGTVLGGGAGALALPEFVRSSYIDALQNGDAKDSRDFAIRMGGVLWNSTKQGLIGGLTAGTGKVVGAGMNVVGAGAIEHAAVTTMAELGVMTTATAGLEGRLPKPEEFIDGAVLLAGFKASTSLASGSRRAALNTIRENLQKHWAHTGEPVMDTLSRAMEDPAFRNILVSDMPPDAHPGSSKNTTDIYGDFVVQKPETESAATGRELPDGVRFQADEHERDPNDSPIEHTAQLTGTDGAPLYKGKITQLDTKMWDIDKIEKLDGEDLEVPFIASAAKYAEDRGGRLMTGMQDGGLPKATLDKLNAAGLLEEVNIGRSNIYQIHGTKRPPSDSVRPVEGNSPSLGLPHSTAAKTGDANVDAVINRSKVKEAIDNPQIDRTKDIPDWAGASGPADDLRTHIDRHIPRSVMLNGVTFDPAVPINIHEQVERSKMEELIPQFVKEATDARTVETPITPEEKASIRKEAEQKAYKIAHEDYATQAEHSWLRSHNIPVDQYEALFEEWGKSINSYDPENLPNDLYMVNKHGPTDLGPQAALGPGAPTGATGTSGVLRPTPSPRNALALATPWTGTVDEARDAILGRMADPRKGPGIWQRIKDSAFKIFLEMIEPDHAINVAADAIERGGSLNDFNNPKFAHRIAELAPNQAMYTVNENMVDFGGRRTGPGLNSILEFSQRNKENFDRFWSYAVARWAIEKAQQNKETGVNLSAAHHIVDTENLGGTVVPPENPIAVVGRLVPTMGIYARMPGTHMLTDTYGPHYMPAHAGNPPEINIWQPGTGKNLHEAATKGLDYEAHFGTGMNFDVILAHEIGHAVAYEMGWSKGDVRAPADREALRQELTIHSRRYKPEWWQGNTPLGKLNQTHIRKSSELIADAMATWMTEPGARARMPVFERLMDANPRVPNNWRTSIGEVPDNLGTEASRSFEDLVDWQNGTLQWLRDSGILNGEQYLKLVAENQSRIPGYREPQRTAKREQVRGPGPGLTTYDPVKEFLGSGSKIEDIQQSLLGDAFLRMQLATRNKLNRTLADNLQPLNLAGKVRDPALKLNLTIDELREIVDAANGPAKGLMTPPDNYGIWRVINKAAKPDEVPIFRDGKLEKWKFEDPELTRYIKGFNDQAQAELWKITSKFAKMLRFGVVMNPLFPVRLAGYDIPWQFITKPEMRNTLFGYFEGLAHSALYRAGTTTPTYDAWLRSGGAERVFDGLTKSQFIKDNLANKPTDSSFLDGVANAINSPYHALRAWAQINSEAQRVGRFSQGLRAGETPLRAGVASSESAFHRASFGGPVLRNINQNIPFMAAYINSLNQTFRSQLGIGQTITGQKYNALAFTAKAAAVITMPMLMQYYGYQDKDWYKAAPDWQKDNGLFFPIGGTPDKPDHVLFYKYPPLLSFIYGGLPRRLLAAYQSENPDVELSKGWQGLLGSALPPGLQYTILQPLIENLSNHSWFTGQPIMSPDVIKNFTGQPQQQFNQYSTETAKTISKFMHDTPILNDVPLSPWQIDHLIQGWAGTAGDAAVRYTEMAAKKAGLLPDVGPGMKFPEDYPLFRSWAVRFPSASAQPIKDFYDRMAVRQGIHDSLVKDMTLGHFDDFKKTLDANPTDGAYHSFRMRQQNGALTQLNNGTFDDAKMVQDNNPRGVQRYIDALQDAQGKGDRAAAEAAIIAEKALKALRTEAIILERTKNGPASGSANDKRQNMDRLYSEMQTYAEHALKAMDRARM